MHIPVDKLDKECKRIGLKINIGKTEVIDKTAKRKGEHQRTDVGSGQLFQVPGKLD